MNVSTEVLGRSWAHLSRLWLCQRSSFSAWCKHLEFTLIRASVSVRGWWFCLTKYVLCNYALADWCNAMRWKRWWRICVETFHKIGDMAELVKAASRAWRWPSIQAIHKPWRAACSQALHKVPIVYSFLGFFMADSLTAIFTHLKGPRREHTCFIWNY